MKCPKCHYLSFEPEPRCKNCGYDLEVVEADLAIDRHVPDGGAADLILHEPEPAARRPAPSLGPVHPVREPAPARVRASAGAAASVARALASAPVARPGVLSEPADDPVVVVSNAFAPDTRAGAADRGEEPARLIEPPRRPARAPHTTTDLPLFVKGLPAPPLPGAQAETLEAPPPAPAPAAGPPLSARRVVRPDRVAALGAFDRDLLADLGRVDHEDVLLPPAPALRAGPGTSSLVGAKRTARLGAGLLDAVFLSAIASVVWWGTLRVAQAGPSQIGWAAGVPLALFVAVVAIGYSVLFTAGGGQTLGKMVAGVRVVGSGPHGTDAGLTLGQAAVRAIVAIPSVGCFGLGWWPAFFGRRRAVHDRVAATRVVRA